MNSKKNKNRCFKDKMAIQRIKAAEKAKIELSSLHETTISLPYLTVDSNGPKNFETKLRSKFEDLISDMIQKTVEPCRNTIIQNIRK